MITVNKATIEAIILMELGVIYCAEDKQYNAPPEGFFSVSVMRSIIGLEKLFYVRDGFDCDNWADELRHDFKKRYWNKYVKKYASANGVTHYPDVFVECIKVSYPDASEPHWFVVALADVGGVPKLIYRERTDTNIVIPKSGWSVLKIK